MTRVNLVPVSDLCDQHLIAEYREIMRIASLRDDYIARGESARSLPDSYRLGTGHVKFFYNKTRFLRSRFQELIDEMKNRGFNVSYDQPEAVFTGVREDFMEDYEPTHQAIVDSAARIRARLPDKARWTFPAKRPGWLMDKPLFPGFGPDQEK